MAMDEESRIFEQLRKAFVEGPHRDGVCLVLEDGMLRRFTEEEDRLMGTYVIPDLGFEGPREMPLYGNPPGLEGWKLILE